MEIMKRKISKKGVAVTGGAAVVVLAILFGTGKLGFGTGAGLGDATGATGTEQAVVQTVEATRENPESTPAPEDTQAAKIEIRIQGREYNYQNVTYGNADHPLEELLEALKEFPPDTRIELVVEDNATKNAVDDLETALAAAGFTDVHN